MRTNLCHFKPERKFTRTQVWAFGVEWSGVENREVDGKLGEILPLCLCICLLTVLIFLTLQTLFLHYSVKKVHTAA